MAISTNTVWEVRTTGDDTFGGGFVTGASGTDRSQSNTAFATLTTASVVHSTTTQLNVSAGDYIVTSADVGNIFQLNSGTATAGFYQITAADVPNNRWTMDRALGTAAQTCAGKMGGALATLGKLGHSSALGGAGQNNRVWVKSGTYTLTTATPNISGGPLQVWTFGAATTIEGYQTTRGDRAARPVISAGSVTGLSSGLLYGGGSRAYVVINMEADANNGVGNTIGFGGANAMYYKCLARNASVANAAGFNHVGGAYACTSVSCTIGFGINVTRLLGCIAATCGTGYFTNSAVSCAFCTAIGCTTYGFTAIGAGLLSNCISYNCQNGFNAAASNSGTSIAVNCIAYTHSQYGFQCDVAVGFILRNCAAGNNTSGNFLNCAEEGTITLTANPFTNAGSNDFSLNNTAGGGALLRAAGPRWGDGLVYDQANYQDVGGLQHQDTGGSGAIGVIGS